MVEDARVQAFTVPWRKVCAALPAVALIGSGLTLTALAGPAGESDGVVARKVSPAIAVPDVALEGPTARPESTTPQTRALALPEGTVPGSSTPVTLDSAGIPDRVLKAYRDAASLIRSADPGCHIDWALLAAIGRVESNHARFAGNRLDSAGVARPGIIGISLNGSNGTARIADSDGGRLDRDSVYDRAVGPMQFIPTTWRLAGADADGDSARNPQDIADATTASALYLCSGPGDLRRPADLRAALLRYNASDSYVRTVIAIADAYRRGVAALPASALPASHRPSASSAWSTSVAAKRVTKPLEPTKATPRAPAPGRPSSIPTDVPAPQPTATLGAPAPSAPPASPASPSAPSTTSEPVPTSCLPVSPGPDLSSVPAEAVPDPLIPVATASVPAAAVPDLLNPVATASVPAAAVPDPLNPVATASVPAAAAPDPLNPCLPLATPPTALHPAGPPQ